MGLRLYTTSYGSPGDVENLKVSSPGTLSKWQTEAKKALEEYGGFVECIGHKESESEPKKMLVNIEQIEWIYEE